MGGLTIPASADLTLDGFVDRLAANQCVAGILLMGSTAVGNLTPWSDYDVLVVFDEMPAPLKLVTTWVDGRLTEVYCTTAQAIRRIAGGSEFPAASEEGVVVGWLQSWPIAFDRSGLLTAAREATTAINLIPPSNSVARGAWRSVGYNVAQLLRYAASPEIDAGIAVEMRLLYSLGDVMVAYFTARGLVWRGEKAAIAYWRANDPSFLDEFHAAITEQERERKLERYAEVARLSVAPVGPLWENGTTMVGLGAGYGSGETLAETIDVAPALATWAALFEHDTTLRPATRG